MAANMGTEEFRPLRKPPPARPVRVLTDIVKREYHGSAELAAMDGELNSEEYVLVMAALHPNMDALRDTLSRSALEMHARRKAKRESGQIV
jgi:hypothetical protein